MATIEIYDRKTGALEEAIPCHDKAEAERLLPSVRHQMNLVDFGVRITLTVDEALPLVKF